jgi:hypothetical protein
MKWLNKLLIIACLSVAFSPLTFAETNSCEVAKEARQPEAEVDISDVNTFVVCNVDNSARAIHSITPKSFLNVIVQGVAEFLELDTSKYYSNDTDIVQIIVSGFITWIMPVIQGLFILGLGITLYRIAKAKDKKEEMKNNLGFVFLFLVLGLVFFNDLLLVPLTVSASLFFKALLNYVGVNLVLFMAGNFEPEDKNITESVYLTSFDKSLEPIVSLAQLELRTKYATLSVKGYEMTKADFGGFLDSNSTLKEILNNIENNQVLKVVPRVEDGIVNTIDFVWNTDFEDYDDDKYGESSKPASMSVIEDTASYEDTVSDTDKMADLKRKGQQDALSLVNTSTMLSLLNVFKNESLRKLKEGNVKDLERLANLPIVNFFKNDLTSKLNAVRSELKMESISGKELSLYVAAYVDGYTSGLKGFNTAGTSEAYLLLGREAALAQREWNCSNEFKNNKESRILSEEVNGSGNRLWADIYKKILSMNTQCIVSENGNVRVNGVDTKTNLTAQEEFKFQSMAVAYAINRYNSHVSEGIHRAYKEQQKTKNEYANSMLKHIDKGFLAVAKIQDSLSDIKSHENLMNSIIFSNASVSYFGSVSNELFLDYQKLFGESNIADITGLDQYKTINTLYKPIVVSALVNGRSVNLNSSELRIAEDVGVVDSFSAAVQGQFTTLTAFKKALGLDTSKSFESGMQECNNTDVCLGRRTGTISDFMNISAQSLGIGLKMAATLALIDALDSVKNLGSVIEYFGFDGKKGFGAAFSKLLSFVGGTVSVIIDLIQVISAVLWNLAYILIILGFYVGYWLPAMLVVSFLMLEFFIPATLIPFIVFICAFALKAAITRRWMDFFYAFQIIGSTYASIFFRLIGLLFATILITWFPIGFIIYEVFDFAYKGDLFTLIIAYILSLFVSGILYKAATNNLVEFITDKGAKLFNVGSSLFSQDSSSDLANMGQALIIDRFVNNSIKNASDSLKGGIKEKFKEYEDKKTKESESLKESTSTKGI